MTDSTNPLRTGPLTGVRVLEFGQIAAGPFAGSLLADLGADVVKVENPSGGDGMRNWTPLSANSAGEAYSENFASLNRSKRSITADVKREEDVAHLHRLAAAADVVIENFRPGALARARLGYADLAGLNPRLVYCSISGYGQTGPNAGRGAFDVTVQGFSGLMSITGHEGMPPVKCGVPVADVCAGLYAAYTITAALMQARESGRGCHIDCSMLGSVLGISALQTSEFFGTGQRVSPMGSAHPRNAPYQAFKAKDDYFIIAAGNDALWAEVAQAVGRPDLVTDPRFRQQRDRALHQKELAAILEDLFATRNKDEWLAEMNRRGVPAAPINGYADVLSDPHVDAMKIVRPIRLPNGVETRTVAFPVSMSSYALGDVRPPPGLGEHQDEVDREWLGSTAEPGRA